MHLTLVIAELGLRYLVDLQGAIFGQDGAESELGGVEVRVMLTNELLELAGARREAANGLRGTAEEVAGVVGEGIREGLTGKGREFEILEEFLEVPLSSLGPPRTSNDHWWSVYTLVGASKLLHLSPQGYHLGDISRTVNDEVECARGDVLWVCPVDIANASDGMGGPVMEGVAMVFQEYLETVGWRHGAGLRPTDMDLVEIAPLEDLGAYRLADEGEVLQDPGVL